MRSESKVFLLSAGRLKTRDELTCAMPGHGLPQMPPGMVGSARPLMLIETHAEFVTHHDEDADQFPRMQSE